MRQSPIALGLGAVLLVAGCNTFPITKGSGQQTARVPAETPSKESLIAYLNDNASRVQSFRCNSLDLDARSGLQSVGLRGKVVCQKPRNFRMGADVLGKQEVDMGSNDQEFWFWIAKNDPPYLYHCSYDDLNRGNIRLRFPFQPDWIMEAMGLSECGPPENYQLKVTQTSLELVEQTRSPAGQVVRKVTVFSRAPAVGTQPQVTAHILQDASGKEICSAQVTEVQIDRTTGAILPRRVRLLWPEEKMELKMKLDDVVVNDQSIASGASRLFTRPNLANVSTFDMARGPDASPDGVRRTGGTMMK